MSGLDDPRRPRIVAQRAADLANADLERSVGYVNAGPDRIEQFLFGDKTTGTGGEILE